MNTLAGEGWTLRHCDCREAFLNAPAGSVHTVVTSPPYWGGVRDYGIGPSKWADGWEGCFGNEPTVEQYVAHTLEVFEALGHALREDGVIWWNIGDCYNAGTNAPSNPSRTTDVGGHRNCDQVSRTRTKIQGMKVGNKALVPYRVALAIQDAGWIVRQDVIWRKPSPMPESIDGWRWERCKVKTGRQPVADGGLSSWDMGEHAHGPSSGEYRWQEKTVPVYEPCPGCDKCRDSDGYILRKGSWRPTTAHEFVFQIVRSEEYFCDAAAAKEPVSQGSIDRFGKKPEISKSSKAIGQEGTNRAAANARMATFKMEEGRNPRSVWTISSEAYKGKHFAAFPTMLAWKCIQASTSAGGCCGKCGSQYAPVVEKGRVSTRPGESSKVNGESEAVHGNRDPQRHVAVKRTLGYRATCNCNAGVKPCVVADPFTGSGTVLQVSINTGRQFFGSEIAEHYLPLIQKRAETPWVPKTEKRPAAKKRKRQSRERLLFG